MSSTEQSDTEAIPSSTELTKRSATELAPPGSGLTARCGKTILTVLGSALIHDPIPLKRPIVSADFDQVSLPLRMLEALLYACAIFEYRIGPNGWLRAWLFTWLRLLLLMTIPLLALGAVIWVFVPVTSGMDSVFQSIAKIAHSFELACGSLFRALLYLVGTLVIIAGVVAVLAILAKRNQAASAGGRSKFVVSKQR